jgi:hypothetical protein
VAIDDAKLIAKPAQRKSRGLRDTHDEPAIFQSVAKSVHAPFGVERGEIGCGENNSRGSYGCADSSRRDDANADCSGRLIARARYYRRSAQQSRCGRAVFGDSSANLG